MKAKIIVPLVTLLGACASAPKNDSVQGFGELVFEAIKDDDRAALVRLLPPEREVLAACLGAKKEDVAALLRRAQDELTEDYGKCAAIDWKGAKITKVEGGEIDLGRRRDCPDAREIDDIRIEVTIADRKNTIEIEDGVLLAGRYYLADGLYCSAGLSGPHPAVAVTKKAADTICACADSECAQRAAEQFATDIQAAVQSVDGGGSAEDAKAIGAESQRMVACITKLAEPQPPQPESEDTVPIVDPE